MSLQLVPVHLDAANSFVDAHHRHADPVLQARYAAGAALGGQVVAVAIAGRPVNRLLQDGWTLEVLRVCVEDAPNACSFLYGAAWRAIRAFGYHRAITYTRADEPGGSPKAAGFIEADRVRGRDWNCKSRPRDTKHQIIDRIRWEIRTSAWREDALPPPVVAVAKGDPAQMELAA